MKRLIAVLSAIVLSLSLAATASAAKPVAIPASISINQANVALGDNVTFSTSYPKGTKNAWISVTCYQGTALVYGEGGVASATFGLGGASSDWVASGGSAECTAELGDLFWQGGQQQYVFLARTAFHANDRPA